VVLLHELLHLRLQAMPGYEVTFHARYTIIVLQNIGVVLAAAAVARKMGTSPIKYAFTAWGSWS
jgi:hypothetical protein